jgi:hypothetical protein
MDNPFCRKNTPGHAAKFRAGDAGRQGVPFRRAPSPVFRNAEQMMLPAAARVQKTGGKSHFNLSL